MVDELHVELVGGPQDGREVWVPAGCDCGSELVPGAIVECRGASYVLGGNRGYAFFLPEAQVA